MTQEYKVGDTGPYISKIQRTLNELLQIHLVTDGTFGPVMRDAVVSCQAKYKLKSTGTYSPGLAAICDPIISTKYLTPESFQKAANLLQVPKAVVQAVQKVETAGFGFLDDGRATILFERHIFRKRLMAWMKLSVVNLQKTAQSLGLKFIPNVTTLDMVDKLMLISYPNIYNTETGGYMGKEKEYPRLETASLFDPVSALSSASWGLFQIMGFNYGLCGYNSVLQYVTETKASEQNQLSAFANFVKADGGILHALQTRNWHDFSVRYNGPTQVDYDSRIQQAVTYFELNPQ